MHHDFQWRGILRTSHAWEVPSARLRVRRIMEGLADARARERVQVARRACRAQSLARSHVGATGDAVAERPQRGCLDDREGKLRDPRVSRGVKVRDSLCGVIEHEFSIGTGHPAVKRGVRCLTLKG